MAFRSSGCWSTTRSTGGLADRERLAGSDGVVIDELVGEMMRLRGELGRAGNTANQAVRDARRLDSEMRKAMRLNEAIEAVREIAKAACGGARGGDDVGAVAVIPNITRGGDMDGVVGYLAGPGNENEHENPTLIAASLGIARKRVERPQARQPRDATKRSPVRSTRQGLFGVVKSGDAIRRAVR